MKIFVSKIQNFKRFNSTATKTLDAKIIRDIENNDLEGFKRHCLPEKFNNLYDIRESYTFRFPEYGNVKMGGLFFYYGFQLSKPSQSFYFYENDFEGLSETNKSGFQPSLAGPKFVNLSTEEDKKNFLPPPYFKFTWGKEWNVLMLSVANDSFEVFKFLLQNGADPNLKTEQGRNLADFIESRESKEEFYKILKELHKTLKYKALTVEEIKQIGKK